MRVKQPVRISATMGMLGLIMAVIVAQAATAAGPELPAVLTMLPADPAVAVVVPNLAQLSQKVSKFNTTLGLGNPELADVVGKFKHETGINQGFDPNGSLMFVLTDLPGGVAQGQGPGQEAQEPLALLVPITDYAAFIGNFQGQEVQGIAELKLPNSQIGFAKKLGGYAVVSPNKQLVVGYQPGLVKEKLAQLIGKVGQQCIGASDVAAIINVEKMAPMLQPLLQQGLTQAMAQMDQAAQTSPQADPQAAEMMPMAKMFLEIYSDAASAVLRDTSGFVIGFDLNDQGVGLWKSAQFKADSQLARIFAKGGGASAHLAKLDGQPYMFAMAADFQSLQIAEVIDGLSQRLQAHEGGMLADLCARGIGLMRSLKGMASVYYPAGQAGMGLFNTVAICQTDDGPAYLKATREYIESCNNLKWPVPPVEGADPNSPPAEMSFTATYTPHVMEVDGVSVDQYQTQVNLPPQMMQEMGPMMPFLAMTGATGQTGLIANKNNYVVVTNSADPQLIKQALHSIAQDAGLGTAGPIQELRATVLPGNPLMEFYISIGGIMDAAAPFLAMMGQPPIQVPQDLPPIASAVSVQDGGLVGRFYVPMRVISFCTDVVKDFTSPPPPPQGNQQQQPKGQQGQQQRRNRSGGGAPPAPRN